MLRRRPPGRRVAVVGNCQSFGYAFAVKLFDPALSVDRFALVAPSWTDGPRLRDALAEYDLVFCQDFGRNLLRDHADSQSVIAGLTNVVRLPTIAFYGFHPDTIHLLDPTQRGRFVLGPTGVHHSALILFAHRRGLSVDQAEALFTREVFDYVGYLDAWQGAVADVLRAGVAAGMKLDEDVARWSRGGSFMYTPTHPRPQVMFDIARRAMKAAGLETLAVNTQDYAVDDMSRDHILPIYPPLAEHYGLVGSTVTKLAHYRFSRGVGDMLTLRDFIARSFAAYGRRDRAQIVHPRVEEWLGSEETSRALTLLSLETLKRRAGAA